MFGGEGFIAEGVGIIFFDGHGDAWVFDEEFFGVSPPFFKFSGADEAVEVGFEFGGGHGAARVFREGFDDDFDGLFFDEVGDGIGFGLLTDEEVVFIEDFEFIDAEGGVHGVATFAVLEVDDELIVCAIKVFNLSKAPAFVNAVGAGMHFFQNVSGSFEVRFFGDY